MTSINECANEASKLGMPTTIWVQLGSLKVAAVLSTSSWISLMTSDIYRKLKEACADESIILNECSTDNDEVVDGCGGIKEILKNVKLNVSIEEQTIPVNVFVVRSLVTDLVLGGEFIAGVKGTFHFGLGAFKWQYQNKMKITKFITDPEKLNIRKVDDDNSGETTSNKTSTSASKNQNRSKTSNENESTCWSCDFENALLTMAIHGKLSQKASDKSKKPIKSSSKNQSAARGTTKNSKNARKSDDEFFRNLRNCFLNDENPLKAKNASPASGSKPPKSGNNSEPSCSVGDESEIAEMDEALKNLTKRAIPKHVDNWKTVYVMTKEWHDIFGGNPMVYNGIFWSKGNKFNLVFSEELDDKTIEGFHLIAIAKVIQIAEDNKWSGLRVVSNDKLVTHLLNTYLLTSTMSNREDIPFFTKIDYKAYVFICTHLGVLSPIKFESAHPAEESGLRKLERIIDTYVLDMSD